MNFVEELKVHEELLASDSFKKAVQFLSEKLYTEREINIFFRDLLEKIPNIKVCNYKYIYGITRIITTTHFRVDGELFLTLDTILYLLKDGNTLASENNKYNENFNNLTFEALCYKFTNELKNILSQFKIVNMKCNRWEVRRKVDEMLNIPQDADESLTEDNYMKDLHRELKDNKGRDLFVHTYRTITFNGIEYTLVSAFNGDYCNFYNLNSPLKAPLYDKMFKLDRHSFNICDENGEVSFYIFPIAVNEGYYIVNAANGDIQHYDFVYSNDLNNFCIGINSVRNIERQHRILDISFIDNNGIIKYTREGIISDFFEKDNIYNSFEIFDGDGYYIVRNYISNLKDGNHYYNYLVFNKKRQFVKFVGKTKDFKSDFERFINELKDKGLNNLIYEDEMRGVGFMYEYDTIFGDRITRLEFSNKDIVYPKIKVLTKNCLDEKYIKNFQNYFKPFVIEN